MTKQFLLSMNHISRQEEHVFLLPESGVAIHQQMQKKRFKRPLISLPLKCSCLGYSLLEPDTLRGHMEENLEIGLAAFSANSQAQSAMWRSALDTVAHSRSQMTTALVDAWTPCE